MNQSYLITGTPSEFMTSLVSRILDQRDDVTLLLDEGAEGFSTPEGLEGLDQGLRFIQNNPRSSLPSKSYFLALENESQNLNHAIHLFHPSGKGKNISELDSGSIDRFVDTSIKGFLFPLKETLSAIQKQKSGSVTFICIGGMETILPPVESLIFGAIQELARSLFNLYQNESTPLRGIHAPFDIDQGSLLDYTLELIQDDSPKTRFRWNRYTGKSSLFGMRR